MIDHWPIWGAVNYMF
uniref:Uncharacterized protein n=1 Tax=Arundo donax TaxID=35708 RepID=A0A0A9C5N1_ARUDO